MCAGNRPEREDQHDENCARRQRVAEQGKRDVSARELFAHDARADDRCDEQPRSEALCREPFFEGEDHAFFGVRVAPSICPISRSRLVKAILSKLANGKAMKHAMRLRMKRKALVKARSISMSEPTKAAGSSIPQCAVIGWPGQT